MNLDTGAKGELKPHSQRLRSTQQAHILLDAR